MENDQNSINAGQNSESDNEQADKPQDTAKDEEVTSQTDSYIENQENSGNWNINLLLDVELPVRVSFGQTEMQLRDVFKLGAGSVIELDKSVNDPVTVIVNNKPIAKGEVVMVDGNYGVRILEVESTADRIRSLG
jgi:flagellar motor switch protein FliN/FliY